MKRSADVVIIGGGCMGASVAYHLARRGVTDVVLARAREDARHRIDRAQRRRRAASVLERREHSAVDRVDSTCSSASRTKWAIAVDFHQDGYLFLLSAPSSVETFRQNVALQRSLGVDVEWLDAAGARRRWRRDWTPTASSAATFCARDGIADPNGVTMGFAKAAQAAGVTIERDTEVTGIRVAAGRVAAVETTRGTIETRTVVNAAGPHARAIGRMAGIDVPVDPYRRHIFIAQRARRPAAALALIADHGDRLRHDVLLPPRRRGLLFGMGDPHETPTFDMTVQWDFLPQVIEVAVQRLPALADAAISHAWAGLYEVTPDANPIIGPAPGVDGLFLINGFSGHGFQHSPAAGRILADVIAGRDPKFDLTPFALDRFATGAVSGERYMV